MREAGYCGTNICRRLWHVTDLWYCNQSYASFSTKYAADNPDYQQKSTLLITATFPTKQAEGGLKHTWVSIRSKLNCKPDVNKTASNANDRGLWHLQLLYQRFSNFFFSFRGKPPKINVHIPWHSCLWKRKKKYKKNVVSAQRLRQYFHCRTKILAILQSIFYNFWRYFKILTYLFHYSSRNPVWETLYYTIHWQRMPPRPSGSCSIGRSLYVTQTLSFLLLHALKTKWKYLPNKRAPISRSALLFGRFQASIICPSGKSNM